MVTYRVNLKLTLDTKNMLKIKKFKVTEDMTPYQFLYKFFEELPATYYKGGSIQCSGNKLRTYKNLYKLFEYYYPVEPERAFKVALKRLIACGFVNAVFCGDINNVTFFPTTAMGNHMYSDYNCLFISCSNQILFNKVGVLSPYWGYRENSSHFETKIRPLLTALGVRNPSGEPPTSRTSTMIF